jgi:hypothetical protein
MRGSLRASHTARNTARWLCFAVLLALLVLVLWGCARPKARAVAPRPAPPRVLVVGLEHLALRTTAWVELHAWLAAAARSHADMADPDLEAAARAYARVLAEDPRDELLARTTHVLEACDDERCARAAVSGTTFAAPYLEALPGFLDRHWAERAGLARDGMESARAAMTPDTDALLTIVARDLAVDWPATSPVVDVVAAAPEPGADAPIRVLLGARGSCFAKLRDESTHVHDARIVDCVLGYALLHLDERSALGAALGSELAARGKSSELGRAWTALVAHAVATTVSAWEPRHHSALRRSTAAVMPETMQWLLEEWPSRLRGEAPASFAKRYVDALLTESASDKSP